MGLSKAFGTINRTLLWTTLYKKGLPEEMIRHIRRGHLGTKLAPKYKGRYGKSNTNNIGVFQGSAISALLFIIYLDDMMEDLAALNRRTQLPIRIIQDRPHQQKEEVLRKDIQEKDQDGSEEEKQTYAIRNHGRKELQEIKTGNKRTEGKRKWGKRIKKLHGEEKEKREHKTNQETDREKEDNMANTEETIEQRQEQANRRIWKKLMKKPLSPEQYTRKTTRTKTNTSTKPMAKSR